jgi:MFS family permease
VSTETPRSRRLHYGWVVVGAAMMALMISAGFRAIFSVLIPPLEAEFGWGRSSLGAVAALSLFLYGAVAPFSGRLSTRWGPRAVILTGLAVAAGGTWVTTQVTSLPALAVSAGVLVALGAGMTTMAPAITLASRWFVSRTGLVMGILGAGSSAGSIIVIPLVMHLSVAYGWRTALWILAAAIGLAIIPAVALLMRDDPARMGLVPYGAAPDALSPAARRLESSGGLATSEAVQTLPFWLLGGSFFICGYTSTGLVNTHLIAHAVDHGIAATDAAHAFGLMGVMNVGGTIASGWLCDRYGRTGPLAFFYALRGVTLLVLPWVDDFVTLHLFAAVFGLNLVSTIPPTTGLIARIFGPRSAGELYGWILVLHQIGAALGSLGGGVLFDLTGSYAAAFFSASFLAFVAAVMVIAITDAPVWTATVEAPIGPKARV